MRTIVDLPERAVRELDALCAAERISRAEAVRRAVAGYLQTRVVREPPAESFGAWKGRHGDGLSYQQRLRREWDR